jgi:hypothetical protein
MSDPKSGNAPAGNAPVPDSKTGKIEEGLGILGKLDGIMGILKGLFFGIILICVSIYLFRKEDVFGNNNIKGTVKNSLCTKHYSRKGRTDWDCSFNILYNIDNKEYLKSSNDLNELDNSTLKYTDGDSINLRYNPNNKNNITTIPWTYKKIAMVLLIIAIFIIIIPIGWYFLLTKSKNLSTVAGGLTAARVLT